MSSELCLKKDKYGKKGSKGIKYVKVKFILILWSFSQDYGGQYICYSTNKKKPRHGPYSRFMPPSCVTSSPKRSSSTVARTKRYLCCKRGRQSTTYMEIRVSTCTAMVKLHCSRSCRAPILYLSPQKQNPQPTFSVIRSRRCHHPCNCRSLCCREIFWSPIRDCTAHKALIHSSEVRAVEILALCIWFEVLGLHGVIIFPSPTLSRDPCSLYPLFGQWEREEKGEEIAWLFFFPIFSL